MTYSWDHLAAGILLANEGETHALGEWMGKQIAPNQTLTLSGNLGDGKTTLCKAIAAGWGVQATVKSPTFNYFVTYRGERGLLVHLDAYRLSTAEEYESLFIEEILDEPWLMLVEWPERLRGCLPSPTLDLTIKTVEEFSRRIQLLSTPRP